MSVVNLYTSSKLKHIKILYLLLDKALKVNERVIILCKTADYMKSLDHDLWMGKEVWIPHGTSQDGYADEQPIWITDDANDTPNNPSILFICEQADLPVNYSYKKIIEVLQCHDHSEYVIKQRYDYYQTFGHEAQYWHQENSGIWKKQSMTASN